MFKKSLSLIVIGCFILTTISPYTQARADSNISLPAPGMMVNLSPAYQPVIIKGLTVHKDNPFLFDFIVDVGQDHVSGEPLKNEGEKLIKYFLASLAIPDTDVWVNLSPYEKNKMVPEALGQTDMGRDLLEQDYILKQVTASLIYPEKQLGKKFWDTVYAKAQEQYGTSPIPVNTFNKVWIMADRAEVFEHNQTAFVVDAHLKVMLEEDYLALTKHQVVNNQAHSISSEVIRSIVLPELEKEINTGKNFANLRQIFNSIILSSWYKRNLKEALLNQIYAGKSKVNGINLNDPTIKQQIYEQYLEAYKKGVFNYIKEDINAAGASIPHKYFSGGMEEGVARNPTVTYDAAMLGAIGTTSLVDFATIADTVFSQPPQLIFLTSMSLESFRAGIRAVPRQQQAKYWVTIKVKDRMGIPRHARELVDDQDLITDVRFSASTADRFYFYPLGQPAIDIPTDQIESITILRSDPAMNTRVIVHHPLTSNDQRFMIYDTELKKEQKYTKTQIIVAINNLIERLERRKPEITHIFSDWSKPNVLVLWDSTDQNARVYPEDHVSAYIIYLMMKKFAKEAGNKQIVSTISLRRSLHSLFGIRYSLPSLFTFNTEMNLNKLAVEIISRLKKEKEYLDNPQASNANSFFTPVNPNPGIEALIAGSIDPAMTVSAIQKLSTSVSITQPMLNGQNYSDNAQVSDFKSAVFEKGGIDLNTSNGMLWKITKNGRGVEMDVDPAMIARVKREGIDGLSPVIYSVTPISSIWPLVGLKVHDNAL